MIGLPLVTARDDAIELQAGETRLVFTQAPANWNGFYHFAFNIAENRFIEEKA